LQWWHWKLRDGQAVQGAEFLQVVASERVATASTAALELEVNGIRIRVEVGADVGYVTALVAAFRSAC
jgi:hypothetical protein